MNLLQWFRKIHLYVGVFTTPAILFFAFTGVLQTFSLHESARDGSYEPQNWIVILSQIHKKQTASVPPRKQPALPSVSPRIDGAEKKAEPESTPPPSSASQPQHHPLPLKIFFLIVGLSLFTSTSSGLYLSWKYRRDRTIMAALLVAGTLAPLVLLTL